MPRIAVVLPMLLAACGIPRDVDDTMERARGGTIRVGVVVDTPWVTDSAGAVGGIEAALVNEIARGVNARPRWVRGSESALMEALRERELDLVIGGLTAKVPWSKEVAFTRPYYIDTLMLGAPPGTTVPDELRHTPVWVKEGAGAAGFVQKRGGVPRPVGDLHRAGGGNDLVAAPAWQLASLRRVPAGKPLNQQPRVLAAAPGENGWLMHVDTVLKNRKDRIPALLRGVWP